MTTDINVLSETLSKRIARGTAGAKDLSLLQQLLRCERRRCLAVGLMTGALVVVTLQLIALAATH